MINDRGRIKWQPFLIPEHKKRISQMYVAEDDVIQPELDEQMLEQLQETIAEAIERRVEVVVTFHVNKRFRTVSGMVYKADPFSHEIILDSSGERIKIRFEYITNLQMK
jgi:hypothetical protein